MNKTFTSLPGSKTVGNYILGKSSETQARTSERGLSGR